MKHPCRFLFSLTLLMTLYAFAAPAKAPVGSDSSLRETLTRAVQYWQGGKAKDAFLSLDSITSAGLNEANAVTKIKAALWTATYLQEQKKIKPASRFLDSALTWSERYHASDELIRSYEAYAAWHLNAGNPKTAMVAREAAWKLKDSLSNAATAITLDSLQVQLRKLEAEHSELLQNNKARDSGASSETASLKNWIYLLSGVCAILLVIVFLMNGTLQRLRHAPPAPAPSVPRTQAEPLKKAAEPAPEKSETRAPNAAAGVVKTATAEAKTAAPAAAETVPPVRETPKALAPSSGKDITPKLQEVELVLIRAEALSRHSQGEVRAVRNILNEYMAQLPFIMKTLDDAIAKNEAEPILMSLEHLKSYLNPFGMQGTLNLIAEIESEAKTEKVSKLLSRVFQVRNHCRRAADEAKSLLEKV